MAEWPTIDAISLIALDTNGSLAIDLCISWIAGVVTLQRKLLLMIAYEPPLQN